jgi:site-specific DNA recombinase
MPIEMQPANREIGQPIQPLNADPRVDMDTVVRTSGTCTACLVRSMRVSAAFVAGPD